MTKGRLAALCILALALCAGCAAPAGKSGKSEGVRLTLAVAGHSGEPAGRLAETFATAVEAKSGGAIHVSIEYRDAPTSPRAQLEVAPAEAYGVAGLRTLEAPFVLISLAAADRATTGPLANELEQRLAPLRITGLALVPDGLYRPFGYLKPLETPADFEGVAIRAPASPTADALLRLLGAHPVDLSRADLNTVVRSGFARDPAPLADAGDQYPVGMSVAANIVFFPLVEVIAIRTATLDRLPRSQRALVVEAAAAARAETIAGRDEPAEAAAFCRAGGTVVKASPSQLLAMRARARPLLDVLEHAPATSALMRRLERLAQPGDEPTPCGPATIPSTGGVRFDRLPRAVRARLLPPLGSFRRVLTDTALRAAGASAPEIAANDGVATLSIEGDRPNTGRLFFELSWAGIPQRAPCRGRTGVLRGRDFVVWNPDTPCSSHLAFTWKNESGDLDIVSLAGSSPAWLQKAFLGTWKRVDCRPARSLDPRRLNTNGRNRPC